MKYVAVLKTSAGFHQRVVDSPLVYAASCIVHSVRVQLAAACPRYGSLCPPWKARYYTTSGLQLVNTFPYLFFVAMLHTQPARRVAHLYTLLVDQATAARPSPVLGGNFATFQPCPDELVRSGCDQRLPAGALAMLSS